MKNFFIYIFLLLISPIVQSDDYRVVYKNGIAKVIKNGIIIFSKPYQINPSYSKMAEKSLMSMQFVYPVGNCIVVNLIDKVSVEPHVMNIGKAIIYNMQGEKVEEQPFPIYGSFMSPLEADWVISINNTEGSFNSYSSINTQCRYKVVDLGDWYRHYDGFSIKASKRSIEMKAPKDVAGDVGEFSAFVISEDGFRKPTVNSGTK